MHSLPSSRIESPKVQPQKRPVMGRQRQLKTLTRNISSEKFKQTSESLQMVGSPLVSKRPSNNLPNFWKLRRQRPSRNAQTAATASSGGSEIVISHEELSSFLNQKPPPSVKQTRCKKIALSTQPTGGLRTVSSDPRREFQIQGTKFQASKDFGTFLMSRRSTNLN